MRHVLMDVFTWLFYCLLPPEPNPQKFKTELPLSLKRAKIKVGYRLINFFFGD